MAKITGNPSFYADEAEHIGPEATGDNISAKKVALYVDDGTFSGVWVRMTQPGATPTYESRNDTTTDTNLVYLGKALPGADPAGAVWQIKRYNKTAGTMTFADDATTFTKVWNDRVSYGY